MFSSKGEDVWKTYLLETIQSKKQLEAPRLCAWGGSIMPSLPLVGSGSPGGSHSQQNFELL